MSVEGLAERRRSLPNTAAHGPDFWATRLAGLSMWPALQPDDWLVCRDLRPNERPPAGSVVLFERPPELIAHRLDRVVGAGARRRFFLSGDLSGPDAPVPLSAVRGLVTALFRPGLGFSDIPAPLSLGPLGRKVVGQAAFLWNWARRSNADTLPSRGQQSDLPGRLLL